MDRCAGAAAMLAGSDRKDLAVQALARSVTVSDLSTRHGVSRKFVYQQVNKVRRALDGAFISATADDQVLFEIQVTKRWLRQVIVALALMCRGSYLGIIEFMHDMLGASVSMGTVHTVLRSAAEQAGVINRGQDLSRIRTGLHDELFHGGMPVLAGVCAGSTYCYLLAAEQHRDADSWGVHLLDATQQGLKPDYTIANAGQGLRAGQKAAWGGTPCHGDIFHIIRQCEGLANTLSRLAQGATSRRQKLEAKFGCAGQPGPDEVLVSELAPARQTEAQAHWLARDVRTPTQWLSRDVLGLAGPDFATRQALFDFIADELERLEPEDARHIRPVRVALRNQRDDLLAFASVLDKKLAAWFKKCYPRLHQIRPKPRQTRVSAFRVLPCFCYPTLNHAPNWALASSSQLHLTVLKAPTRVIDPPLIDQNANICIYRHKLGFSALWDSRQ